jgi:predicted GH43/DUF377 family glycosyl hydrolase
LKNAFNWQKKGLVFSPSGSLGWARKNASFPTVEILENVYRIYYTSMDELNVGSIGYLEVNRDQPTQVVYQHPTPILTSGEPGAFDDHGVNAFSVIQDGRFRKLYYQGWQITKKSPYCIFSNVATSEMQGQPSFTKISKAPILDRIDSEPFMRAAPFVIKDQDVYKMWYCNCSEWVLKDQRWDYRISIHYLESGDGINWDSNPKKVLTYSDPDDFAVGRPCVVKFQEKFHMWYSIRSFSQPYRLGYAISDDGIHWDRRDSLVGLQRSPSGWDSEMICYPFVFADRDKLHMFYNGNQHGASGFGYATSPLPKV